jgi:hypothetical protein
MPATRWRRRIIAATPSTATVFVALRAFETDEHTSSIGIGA